MERWEWERQPDMMRRGRERVRFNYKPSFSSTLLDSIYRSIDGEDFFDCDGGGGGGDLILYRSDEGPLTRKKPSASERVRRKSAVTTTSSESSFGGFSSSDADSALNYGGGGTDSVRLKPIRTENRPSEVTATKKGVDGGGGSFRSRLRGASKIYSDLKKVRSPVRPGGRFAGFINSLFSAGNQRKHKPATPPARSISADATTPTTTSWSSASSCSRSCLSKSTASSKKANGAGGVKRTVRFYPVSVIVDEDCRPIGHKCIDEAEGRRFSASLTAAPFGADAKRRVAVDDGSDELDLDRSSYSSSELFELENFAERYREELPVYETTHIGTNLAIAKGLIV